jgi:NADP-dependent 3-hydroxy acid dehydrogenase YdfG
MAKTWFITGAGSGFGRQSAEPDALQDLHRIVANG